MKTENERSASARLDEAHRFLTGGGEAGSLMRELDWAATPLGSPDGWPQSLRTAVSILLDSKFPMYIAWGPRFTQFYNDPFRPILGSTKHPGAMGGPASATFAEGWDQIGPMFEDVMRGGSTWMDDWSMPLDRHGFLEECYFTFSYSPIRAEDGIGGVHVTVTETTKRVVSERRLKTLRDLARASSDAKGELPTWRAVADVLSTNENDTPFALLYRFTEDGRELVASTPGLGDEISAVESWPLSRSLRGLISAKVAHEFVGEAWPETVTDAVILPIGQASSHVEPLGALILGLSPRLEFDTAYEAFCTLVADQIAAGVASSRAFEAERARAERLAELDRAKTAFYSNVSHEFRTPLTLMLGPMEEALENRDGLKGESLALAHRNAVRLHKLVNSLLDFARAEKQRVDPELALVDVAAKTRGLAAMFDSAMSRAGLTFIVDCDDVEPTVVDPKMYEHILLNLLSNALKFTLKGEVRIGLRDDGADVVIEVSDTGSGIPADDLEHLFERFYRVEGTRARTHEGSGIGLALVQDLVVLHGGTVSVSSELGAGSTFTVRLPRGLHEPNGLREESSGTVSSEQAARPFVEEAELWLGGQSEASDVIADSGDPDVRVLVVDDNADMRAFLTSILRRHWTVATARDGEEALRRVAQAKPNLIVSDIMMPRMDGFELLEELRANPNTEGIPVVFLSARAGEEARISGFAHGADDYLTKPFSAGELVARVKARLELTKLREEGRLLAARLNDLFMQSPVAIAMTRGPDHRYDLANSHYCEMVSRDDLTGKSVAEVWPEIVGTPLMDVFDNVFMTGEPFVAQEYETALRRNGVLAPCFFKFNLLPLREPDGSVSGMVCTAVEITEVVEARKRAEALAEELRASEVEAGRANAAKDEFLAMLGHELRNPLAPIATALHLMRESPDAQFEYERSIIERHASHLTRLVDDLLDIGRITSGGMKLRRTPTSLSDVVREGIEMASPILDRYRHELVVDLPETDVVVDVDPMRFAQVISNLLTNAAKYTPPGGRVRVEASEHEGEAMVSIADTGVGIPGDLLQTVFELFSQGGQTSDRSEGGLGLGLAIVKQIVTLHGGVVEIFSGGAGEGTEVVVRVPVTSSSITAETARRAAPSPNDGTAAPILVVDDNRDAADLLAMSLEMSGHEVRVAYDGPSALAILAEFRPRLALVDIGLPVMDGYELGRRIREQFQTVDLVAVTGYGQQQDRDRSEAAGFLAHLVKPVDLVELSDVIARLTI